MKKLTIALTILIALLLGHGQGWAATYYMQNGGTAANHAAAGGPCGTQANCIDFDEHEADGGSLSDGDVIILCDDGGVYRDQLDIPTSGTSTGITYEAASGDTPIISGADLVSTWAAFTPAEYIVNGTMEVDDNWNDRGTPTSQTQSNEQKHGGDWSRKLVSGSAWQGINSDTFTTVANTTYTVTVWIYNTTDTSVYINVMHGDDSGWVEGFSSMKTVVQNSWTEFSTTYTESVGHEGNGAYLTLQANSGDETIYFDDASINIAPNADTYRAALATEPGIVLMDTVAIVNGADQESLNDHEWFWLNDYLYLRDATGDPDDLSSPGIEAPQRTYCIYNDGKDYITLDGLQFRLNQATAAVGCISQPIEISMINCAWQYVTGYGFWSWESGGKTDNVLIDTCTFDYVTSAGAMLHGDDCIVRNSTFTDCSRGIDLLDVDNLHCQDFIIRDNLFDGINNDRITGAEHYTSGGYGILLDGDTHGDNADYHKGTIQRNIFLDCIGRAVDGHYGETTITYNLFLNVSNPTGGSYGNAIEINGPNNKVFNNTLVDVENMGVMLNTDPSAPDVACEIKNNIFVGLSVTPTWYVYHEVDRGVTDVFANNLYFNDAGGTSKWLHNGVEKTTYADWVTASSETGSLNADPLMTDAPNADFTLTGQSPCIDAGTNLGSTYDDAIKPGSTWPDGVTTDDQDFDGRWDIGAYRFLKYGGG